MKKTIKKQTIVEVYRILSEAKVTKMQDTEKFDLIKAVRVLKPVSTEFQDFVEEARKKLEPEDFEALREKMQKFGTLPVEEKKEVNDAISAYNDSVSRCVSDDLDKEIEVELTPLSEEALTRLVASNDFTVAMILLIEDAICDTKSEKQPA